jgi:hypothetical protein
VASRSKETGAADVRQSAFAAIVEIESGHEEALRELLVPIGQTIGDPAPRIDLEALGSVHFMRWAVLDPQLDLRGEPIPGRLLLSTNHDGGLHAHLDELIRVGGDTFHEIYAHCTGYPPAGRRSPRAARDFLLAHGVAPQTFYVGAVGRSVRQIQWEARLREALEEHLDDRRASGSLPADPVDAHGALRAWVREQPEFAAATDPAAPPPLGRRLVSWTVGLVRAAVAMIGAIALLLSLPWLRYRERRDPETDMMAAEPGQVRELVAREDYQVQNQMTSLAPMKPGRYRQFVVRTVLAVIDAAARLIYRKGRLGSIASIHFARWMVIDGGRNLLFLSNYDGSWESYLGDFIDKASDGLTAIWSNTWEFPASRWLIKGGARNELPFKAKVRASQVPTEVWYSAYPTLTILNVINNARIREGLARPAMGRKEAEEWLARL